MNTHTHTLTLKLIHGDAFFFPPILDYFKTQHVSLALPFFSLQIEVILIKFDVIVGKMIQNYAQAKHKNQSRHSEYLVMVMYADGRTTPNRTNNNFVRNLMGTCSTATYGQRGILSLALRFFLSLVYFHINAWQNVYGHTKCLAIQRLELLIRIAILSFP